MAELKDCWEDITYRCYRKYERLVDLLAIKQDREKRCKLENINL